MKKILPVLIPLFLVACVQREPKVSAKYLKQANADFDSMASRAFELIDIANGILRERDSLKVLLDKCRGHIGGIKFKSGVKYIVDSPAMNFLPDGIIVNLKNDTVPF
jgi:hypothetical protein